MSVNVSIAINQRESLNFIRVYPIMVVNHHDQYKDTFINNWSHVLQFFILDFEDTKVTFHSP